VATTAPTGQLQPLGNQRRVAVFPVVAPAKGEGGPQEEDAERVGSLLAGDVEALRVGAHALGVGVDPGRELVGAHAEVEVGLQAVAACRVRLVERRQRPLEEEGSRGLVVEELQHGFDAADHEQGQQDAEQEPASSS
jgi:hypothetical protein